MLTIQKRDGTSLTLNHVTMNVPPNPSCCSDAHVMCERCAAAALNATGTSITNAGPMSRAEKRAGAKGSLTQNVAIESGRQQATVTNVAGQQRQSKSGRPPGRPRLIH